MLDTFDHLTVVVRELEAAVASYTRLLGGAPCWRGAHPELGSEAALFALGNAWLELVAPLADAAESEGLRALLATRGEGLQALAWATRDASACSAALRERGLRVTPAQDGSARSSDGSERRFRTVEVSPRAARGLSLLAVERLDPLPSPERSPAPDACSALDHVVIRTSNPDAAIDLYANKLGLRLALDKRFGETRMLFFRLGGVTLEVVHDPALAEHDTFWGAAYRVQDIGAAHARMQASGLTLSELRNGTKPGTRVFTVRDGTANVPTLILHDPARQAKAAEL